MVDHTMQVIKGTNPPEMFQNPYSWIIGWWACELGFYPPETIKYI